MTKYSNGDYKRLGKKIRELKKNNKLVPYEDLEVLQYLRTTYKESLSDIFNILSIESRKVDRESIVTYRVKRIESIISKLIRQPTMQLNLMGDIAGCRCILKSNKEVYRIKEILSQKLFVKSCNDYIENPKEDGYKSLHLIVAKDENDTKFIEIQLRCEIDHNWATLVEITDLIYDTKIKEFNSNHILSTFHKLLSKDKRTITTEDIIEIFKIARKNNYFNKISSVFKRNYIEVRIQWSQIQRKKGHNFYLIEVTKDSVPKIQSFTNFNDAENEYFELFRQNNNANIVLTYVKDASYEQISKAYSNYILTYHQFFYDTCCFIKELI